jgi:phenylacetate-CoA ligase
MNLMHPRLARTCFRLQERMLGRRTFAILKELEKSQDWSRAQLEQLQLRRLQLIVANAYEHTPYWRSVMDDHHIRPADIRALADLQRFPLLDKETVRARREEMVWAEGRRRLMVVRTSGSTNEALQFYTDSEREAHINAARIRGHQWIGIHKGDREMYFWGSPIELSKQDRIKRFRDWLINDGLTNGFELKPEFVAEYFDYWMRWRPKCIFGYPNSLTLMAIMARSQGLDLTPLGQRGLEVISTTSEMLTEPDRHLIEQSFGVPVFDSYGLREGGLVGHECSQGTMHTMDEQLLLETVDPLTLEPTEGEGELVITNIFSQVMPMIRYRTGDRVTLSRDPCPCGLTLGSLRISGGRVAEFVVTADGRWIPGYAFIYICRSIEGIIKFQLRQNIQGDIRILLAVDENFPADGCQQVAEQARGRLRSDDRVTVEVVDDIRPAPSGKYRPVVSTLAEAKLKESRSNCETIKE